MPPKSGEHDWNVNHDSVPMLDHTQDRVAGRHQPIRQLRSVDPDRDFAAEQ